MVLQILLGAGARIVRTCLYVVVHPISALRKASEIDSR